MGNQLRFYHSYEKRIHEAANDGAGTGHHSELIEKGEELVEKVIREILSNHQEGREGKPDSFRSSFVFCLLIAHSVGASFCSHSHQDWFNI